MILIFDSYSNPHPDTLLKSKWVQGNKQAFVVKALAPKLTMGDCTEIYLLNLFIYDKVN